MKFRHLSLLAAFLLLPFGKMSAQQPFVNLTPLPKQMSVQTGTFVFPATFAVGGDGLDKSVRAEVRKFVSNFNKVSGHTATAAAGAAPPRKVRKWVTFA